RALKPGGRFVAECGGAGNVATVLDALHAVVARYGVDGHAVSPWYFPSVDDYRGRLERRGFIVSSIDLIPRPTPLPGRLADWLDTFAESFLAAVPPKERGTVKDELETMLGAALCANGVWTVDYVRLRFAAVKPRIGSP
ncbi:MAG TPA: SAM-dependent methyltransferase, partial [Stellaceae bacterium]|nr:SAM-dependent methyltransferase [Stellaceae bacterium]